MKSRPVLIGLLFMLFALHYKLWFAAMPNTWQLRQQVAEQTAYNDEFRQHNSMLAADIARLKNDTAVLEEYARYELGMIYEGETLYHILDDS